MQNGQENTINKLKAIPILVLIASVYLLFALCLWRSMTILLPSAWGSLGHLVGFLLLLPYVMGNELLKLFINERLGIKKSLNAYFLGILLLGATIATGMYFLLNIEGFLKSFIK